jgi:hypothetical protein
MGILVCKENSTEKYTSVNLLFMRTAKMSESSVQGQQLLTPAVSAHGQQFLNYSVLIHLPNSHGKTPSGYVSQ